MGVRMFPALCALGTLVPPAPPVVAFSLDCAGYKVTFAEGTGALLVTSPSGEPLLWSGEDGLWRLETIAGEPVSADMPCEAVSDGDSYALAYRTSATEVVVRVTPGPEWLDLAATVRHDRTVLQFALPATLRFSAASVERLISPMHSSECVGGAFLRPFFEEQSGDDPTAWEAEAAGPSGYLALFGGPLTTRPDADAPVPLLVTETGRVWLGEGLSSQLGRTAAPVNRPPAEGQADLVLVDSQNGPWLSGSRLGGRGLLLRVGGLVPESISEHQLLAITRCLEHLAGAQLPTAPTVAVFDIRRGPARGGWSETRISEWRRVLEDSQALRELGVAVQAVAAPGGLFESLDAGDRPWAVVNPYGEALPLPEGVTMAEAVRAIGDFVRAGGIWCEVGGHPFFYALRPVRHLSYGTPYPPAFADYQRLETASGAVSLYRVAPTAWEPWAAARDPSLCFVPGSLAHGRDESGPYCRRAFHTYVPPGEEWATPTVRIAFGGTALSTLRDYARANELVRPLRDKLGPERFDALRHSVVVRTDGPATVLKGAVGALPRPSVLHIVLYLKGGFDKEYPDHLPPSPSWGTEDDLRALIAVCREHGVLFMPYTNPTWWCDNPRGPTFEAAGEAPLAVGLGGRHYHERYGPNDGWTTTFWHPAVRAANERTVRQFTESFPVGILFQDQCGARGWVYDLNPSSPTPFAYTEGLLSMVREDSEMVPLSTECGWDRLLPYVSQFCGITWALVPSEHAPPWVSLYADRVPLGSWEPFPLAQALGHESVAFIHHDLGQFVTSNEGLAWTLGLGYNMSYAIALGAIGGDGPGEWLRWLDAIQKTICARYTGEPLESFSIERESPDDPGVMTSQYGPVKVVANLSGRARPAPGRPTTTLAPYGFVAEATDALAGGVTELDGVRMPGGKPVWFTREVREQVAEYVVFAPERSTVALPLPSAWGSVGPATLDGGACQLDLDGGVARFTTRPAARDGALEPPAELASEAPSQWPLGRRPNRIGVIAPADLPTVWTTIRPLDWLEALASSAWVQAAGIAVERIDTAAELRAALAEEASGWFAIVNPLGEVFLAAEGLDGYATVDAIRDYVRNGGIWWETGGYSFYTAAQLGESGMWEFDTLAGGGLGRLGITAAMDPIDAPPVSLEATEAGRHWLQPQSLEAIGRHPSQANRGAGSGPPTVCLVASSEREYVFGYRLDGWGWLWRIGGLNPIREVALPVVVDTLEHLYTHPPLPLPTDPTPRTWRLRVERR